MHPRIKTTLASTLGVLNFQASAVCLGGWRVKTCSTLYNQWVTACFSERSLHGCQRVVYAGTSAQGGQPILSPQPVLDTLSQLDTMLQRLERGVVDVLKDIDGKKQVGLT